jgi:hypothetical protein
MPADPAIKSQDGGELTVRQKAQAIYAGTEALHKACEPISNVISAIAMNRTPLEDATAGTYYRMCLLMESLTRLNSTKDFQVSLHCARCMYELYLDIADLLRDPSSLAKFQAFTFVTRFAAAEKLVKELENQGITDPSVHKPERDYIANTNHKRKYDDDRKTYWPDTRGNPSTPLQWSGMSLPGRARMVGDKELLRYRQLYSILCWYSHAGLAGISNISEDGLVAAMGMAHANAQNFFHEATRLVANKFEIYKAVPSLKTAVDQYTHATAHVMLSYSKTLRENCQVD